MTLVEPGPFATKATTANHVVSPVHPAYDDPSLPSAQHRAWLAANVIDGDPDKAAKAIYRLSKLKSPPLRLPLHKYAINGIRAKIASVVADVDKYESWSDDLLLDH